jgi:hypothetical protein
MSDGNSQETFVVHYRLARTVVKIDGTVATQSKASGAPSPTVTSAVSISVDAEPGSKGLRTVDLDGGRSASASLNISLAPDGRLVGAGDTATGIGGELLSATVSVASTAAAAIGKIEALQAIAPEGPVSAEQRYSEQQEDAAKQRGAVSAAVATLEGKLASLLNQAAESPSKDVGAELAVLEGALTFARTEASNLQTAFESGRRNAYPTVTEAFTELLGTDELPLIATADNAREFKVFELSPDAARAANTIRIVIALVGDVPLEQVKKERADGLRPPVHARDDALVYRTPRRVEVAVYKAIDEPSGSYRLQSITPAWIIDERSDLAELPLQCGLFDKHSMTAAFGESGTLAQLNNAETPAIAGVASALKGVAGDVVGAVEDATKLTGALPAPATDPSLKPLEQEVVRKDLEARLATAEKTIGGGSAAAKAP